MARSTQQQLDDLDVLIQKLEASEVESYSIGSRSRTHKKLDAMYDRRDKLENRLQHETGSSTMLAKFGRTSR